MLWTEATISMVGVASGFLVAAFSLYLGHKQKSLEITQRTEEQFFHTLDWLSGRTQRRNLGITAVAKYWTRPELRNLTIPLLISTVIYLLRDSSQCSRLENRNLDRMMRLLLSVEHIEEQHREDYRALMTAIEGAEGVIEQNHARCAAKQSGSSKDREGSSEDDASGGPKETGIPVDPKVLAMWKYDVQQLLEAKLARPGVFSIDDRSTAGYLHRKNMAAVRMRTPTENRR